MTPRSNDVLALRVLCCIVLAGLLLLVVIDLRALDAARVEPDRLATHASLPLFFEANQGQADPEVRFLSHGEGYTLFLTPTETVLVEGRTQVGHGRQNSGKVFADSPSAQPAVLRMKLLGANPRPEVAGAEQLPGKVNYLIGNDPTAWHTGVPLYSQVRSGQVYPGIDLLFHGDMHGDAQQLEYDFIVSPGADPNAVRFRITGAKKIDVDYNRDLELHTADGQDLMHMPVIYQPVGSERRLVERAFALKEGDELGFQLATYRHRQRLFTDPTTT